MEEYIKTIKDTPHERQVKVLLTGGRYVLIYLRHPMRRNPTVGAVQESHQIYITRLGDISLSYEDWQRFQFAINFISLAVDETKPGFERVMANTTERIDVYS
jgi:hypothetical protein